MNNPQFSVSYNGHPVAVTILDNDTYIVQVTYKPVQIERKKDTYGGEKWVESDSQLETYVTNEVGRLISNHYHRQGQLQ